MTTLLIEDAAGIKMTKVPFTGGSKSFKAILSGTVDVMVGSAKFAAKGKGRLRTLGITSKKRAAGLPDIPTFTEQGYKVVSERFRAFAGPKGISQKVIDYWGDICKKTVNDSGFVAAMKKIGQPAQYRGPAAAQASIDGMAKRMKALVDKYGLAQ